MGNFHHPITFGNLMAKTGLFGFFGCISYIKGNEYYENVYKNHMEEKLKLKHN